MPGTIELDMEGSSISSGLNGEQWNRRYLITGMENGPSIPALYVEAYALIPDRGTAAPAPLVNLFVRDASIDRVWCEPDQSPARWSAEGTIFYSSPNRNYGGSISVPDNNGPAVLISGSSSVVEVDVDQDISGPPVQLTTTSDNVTLAHTARSFAVARNITVGRLEVNAPYSRKNNVEGRLNSGLWNGYAAGTVLLSNLEWTSDDDQNSYFVEYSFSIRDDWTFVAVHEDPFFPGRPLPGATGTARVAYDVIPRADFSLLDLTLPS